MTEAERIARAHRAQSFLDEFVTPMFDDIEAEWTSRLAEVATTELAVASRTDKITALSHALRITKTVRAGLLEAVRDGEIARASKLKAEEIERMSDARQRLLRIAG